ncbi:hypothetical protein HGRIS_002666 [Hohenbuehelia grisea]|uniref:Uncharacterized protein n=1 Tax=Hohenbuehelia grisea TaxID=104357 RepID=A0ABR3JL48_9AGAR
MTCVLPRIRLVTFDLLFTLVAPRKPVHIQYAEIFAPYLGTLNPTLLKSSFKSALRQVRVERPAFVQGTSTWWGEVIRRTALGGGADEQKLNQHLPEIVPALLHRFSSREGYRAYEDVLPTLKTLRNSLRIPVAVVSNADNRMRSVTKDLELFPFFDAFVLSDEAQVEKPSSQIYRLGLEQCNASRSASSSSMDSPISLSETLHIGDELDADYQGAREAGMQALLLRRPDPEDTNPNIDTATEDLRDVMSVRNLTEVVDWIRKRNALPE